MALERPPHPSLRDLPRPVAFVLSGGGVLGAIQAGMARGLLLAGLQPDLLVGTSAGAMNAALLGTGFRSDVVDRLIHLWETLDGNDVYGALAFVAAFRVLTRRGSLSSQRGLRRILEAYLPTSHDALEIPTTCVTADFRTGEPVLRTSGDLIASVLASTAIPGVFPPVALGGQVLIDGGVVANVPLLQAQTVGARTIVVLDAGYPCRIQRLPSTIIPRLVLVATNMIHQQTRRSLALLDESTTVLYLPGPCPVNVAPTDNGEAPRLISAGYQLTRDFLADTEVDGPGIYGSPHDHGDVDEGG